MYYHILIPTDGSPLSTVAVEHSMDFARDADAKVTVLTVVSPFHVFSADASQLVDTRAEYERRARTQAAEILRTLNSRLEHVVRDAMSCSSRAILRTKRSSIQPRKVDVT
jgi:nucleotide-binding universal stress UspA family protein